jgi:hypothetical protein
MTKRIPSQIDGFTPLFDCMVREHGLIYAAIFGRVWRYCQGEKNACTASHQTIAKETGVSIRTVIRAMQKFVATGYLRDLTPTLKGVPHIYGDTGKVKMTAKVVVTQSHNTYDTESQPPMTQSHSKRQVRDKKEKAAPANAAPQAHESSTSTSTFYEMKESDNTTSTSTLDPVLHAMERKLKANTPAHIIGAWRAGEHLKDLCVLFAEVTNAEVVKHDSGKWIGGARRLYELHPTREELVRARDYATKNEFPMTHPGAAVETIKAIRQMNPQKPAALNHPQPVVYEVLENNYDD